MPLLTRKFFLITVSCRQIKIGPFQLISFGFILLNRFSDLKHQKNAGNLFSKKVSSFSASVKKM